MPFFADGQARLRSVRIDGRVGGEIGDGEGILGLVDDEDRLDRPANGRAILFPRDGHLDAEFSGIGRHVEFPAHFEHGKAVGYHELTHVAAGSAIRNLYPAGHGRGRVLDGTQETEVGRKSDPSVGLDRSEFQVGDAAVFFVGGVDAVMEPARELLVISVLDEMAFEDLNLRDFAADGVEWKEKRGGGEEGKRMSGKHSEMIAASGGVSQ